MSVSPETISRLERIATNLELVLEDWTCDAVEHKPRDPAAHSYPIAKPLIADIDQATQAFVRLLAARKTIAQLADPDYSPKPPAHRQTTDQPPSDPSDATDQPQPSATIPTISAIRAIAPVPALFTPAHRGSPPPARALPSTAPPIGRFDQPDQPDSQLDQPIQPADPSDLSDLSDLSDTPAASNPPAHENSRPASHPGRPP